MFSSQQNGQKGFAISLKLSSGETLMGELVAGMSGKLADTLNKSDPFVELLQGDGTSVLIAKSAIAQIAPVQVPRTDQLTKRLAKDGLPDPYTVLGISKSAGGLDIQSAYHALARRYHPDHFSGREMPPEVLQYVSAMFQRITTAYNSLKSTVENSEAA
ncbi:MAG: J domain-containing protein [Aestuariivirgaceae bacterium]